MFEITLITVGKLKEKFYLSAADEYQKRLSGYCNVNLIELPETKLPDNPSPAEIEMGLNKEASLIEAKIPKLGYRVKGGKTAKNEKLAERSLEMMEAFREV